MYDTPLLIVGAGPAGLSLSLNLARRGIRTMVVERRQEPSGHPRAHYVNTRTMELFGLWGIDDAVLAEAFPSEYLPFDMLVDIGGMSPDELESISPAAVCSCAQDRIEAAMRAALDRLEPDTIRWGVAFVDAVDHGDRVEVHLEGPEGPETVTARWLVAADGSQSAIRQQLGIDMIGDPDLGSLVNFYVEGQLYPEGEVPPLAWAVSEEGANGAFISMDGKRRFCFHHNYDPAIEQPEDFDLARAREIVIKAAGLGSDESDVDVEVISIRPWTMTALVAERLQAGRIFLIGDAAHAFPPTGGFGMNSGIQDGHNLAWKIYAVLSGMATEQLLDAYQPERQPVAFLNTAQSLRNANRGIHGLMPSPQAELIDSLASKSVRSMVATAADPDEKLAIEMLEHAGAIGQDLGFAYDQSPVIVDDGKPRPDIQIARYIPNAAPGARAPHLWVTRGSERVTILHVFDEAPTLLVSTDGGQWRAAADALDEAIRPRVLEVSERGDLVPAAGSDFELLYGIASTGAVLVRPDGHVIFRAEKAPDDPTEALRLAVAVGLGREA